MQLPKRLPKKTLKHQKARTDFRALLTGCPKDQTQADQEELEKNDRIDNKNLHRGSRQAPAGGGAQSAGDVQKAYRDPS